MESLQSRLVISMAPDRSCFTPLNLPADFDLPPCMDYFTLTAQPNTSLWRKPPSRDTATAPILYTALRHPFVYAEVTITGEWAMEWDQAGLVIFSGQPPSPSDRPLPNRAMSTPISSNRRHQSPTPPVIKWVKAGIEFTGGCLNASSVCATSDGADWSLTPLRMPPIPGLTSSLRLKLERVGHALWIWYQIPTRSAYVECPWTKLRDVTSFFWGVDDKVVRVGVYASRPVNLGITEWERMHGSAADAGGGERGLFVEFEDLEIF